MSSFVENASRILEAAEAAMRAGAEPSATTILISSDGAIQVLSDCSSPLDSLQMDRGMAMAYRVTQKNGWVRVEGRSGAQSCFFESEKPASRFRAVLPRMLAGTHPAGDRDEPGG